MDGAVLFCVGGGDRCFRKKHYENGSGEIQCYHLPRASTEFPHQSFEFLMAIWRIRVPTRVAGKISLSCWIHMVLFFFKPKVNKKTKQVSLLFFIFMFSDWWVWIWMWMRISSFDFFDVLFFFTPFCWLICFFVN